MFAAGTKRQISTSSYQDKERAGLLKSVPYPYTSRNGTPRVLMQVLVTPKGLVRMAEQFNRDHDTQDAGN